MEPYITLHPYMVLDLDEFGEEEPTVARPLDNWHEL